MQFYKKCYQDTTYSLWSSIVTDLCYFGESTRVTNCCIVRIVCWWWYTWVCFRRGERNVCNKGHTFTAVCL